eukprot:158072-Lingulodinium_polyedra.AAC.1
MLRQDGLHHQLQPAVVRMARVPGHRRLVLHHFRTMNSKARLFDTSSWSKNTALSSASHNKWCA